LEKVPKMFRFLKRKLTTAVKKATRKVEEEPEEKKEEILDLAEKTPEKTPLEEKKEEIQKEEAKEALEEEIEEKGFLKKVTEKVTTKKISESQFEDIFQDLQIALLENNVALEVVDKVKEDLKLDLVNQAIPRSKIEAEIQTSLKKSIEEILTPPEFDLLEQIKKSDKPYVILIIGYNGAGKSLTCARLASYLKRQQFNPLLAAADTFRAAGASQLVEYGKLANVPVISNEETQDSCSVIFDTIKHAKAQNHDIVIADTSGRIQNNQDLMDELKKIARVNNPNTTILVLDSLTGSDVVHQMEEFDKAIAVDGMILTKADVDEKGGAFLSAVYTGKKPVLFICDGQLISSIRKYNPKEILEQLGL